MPLAQSALDAGNEDLVHLLVSFGATFAWPDSDGRQPMHAVASASDSPRRIEMLLAAGVAPDPLTPEGWTPLHFAAIYGYSSVVEALLGHKADPCLTTRTGLSPADLARTNGHEILAERLERACDERARGG